MKQELLPKDCIEILERADAEVRHAAYARMSRRATEEGLYSKFFDRMKDSGTGLAHSYCFLADLAYAQNSDLKKSIDIAYHSLIKYHRTPA